MGGLGIMQDSAHFLESENFKFLGVKHSGWRQGSDPCTVSIVSPMLDTFALWPEHSDMEGEPWVSPIITSTLSSWLDSTMSQSAQ